MADPDPSFDLIRRGAGKTWSAFWVWFIAALAGTGLLIWSEYDPNQMAATGGGTGVYVNLIFLMVWFVPVLILSNIRKAKGKG